MKRCLPSFLILHHQAFQPNHQCPNSLFFCVKQTNPKTKAAPNMKLPPATNAPTNCTHRASADEPNSVLELRGTPSPVAPPKGEDPHHHHALINPELEDWDSWMRELGLHDDEDDSPVASGNHQPEEPQNRFSNLPDFPAPAGFYYPGSIPGTEFSLVGDYPVYNSDAAGQLDGFPAELATGNWNTEVDYAEELIRLAECFETNSVQFRNVILGRLNERLISPSGKPLQRAAFYFKEAFRSLLAATTTTMTGPAAVTLPRRPASSTEIVETIKAQTVFARVSPIPMFSSLTANQALLEAMDGGAMHVHVVDFDIGFGYHWASFMRELADKAAESHKAATPVLRISAVVPEEYEMESNLVRDNLSQFAAELNIRFDVEFISLRSFEFLSFKAVKFLDGETVAVVLSPAIFREIGSGFLSDLRRVSPHVVVHVDVESHGTASYRQGVIQGLELYSTLMESIEAAVNFTGAWEWMRRIETLVLYPKITEEVGAFCRRGASTKEAMAAVGLRPVKLSQFADIQAEYLLRRLQVAGFHVVKRQSEMLLCWHDKPLAAMSAWRF